MNEFNEIRAVAGVWGWGACSFGVSVYLLAKHVVNFDQAVILILLGVFVHKFGKDSSQKPGRRSTMSTTERDPKGRP